MAQIIGGQRDGLGRALVAISDQVANHRQPPQERQVQEPEITIGRGDERRTHLVNQPFRTDLDQAVHHRLDGDLASFMFLGLLVRAVEGRRRQRLDPDVQILQEARGELESSGPADPRCCRGRGTFVLAAQGGQAVMISRFGTLSVKRLEQDDVAIEQPGILAHQAIAESKQEQAQPYHAHDRQRQPHESQNLHELAQLQVR